MIRRADAGSAGKVSLALVAALVLVLTFAVVVSAEPLAPQIPNLPHFFYGNVTTDLGTPLPGMLVTAQAVTGGWTGNSATTVDSMSRYGYGPSFYVPAWDSGGGAGAKNGDTIAFLVNGVQALLYDVNAGTTSSTYTFISGGSTRLDLIVNLKYTITATAGPNGSIDPLGQVEVKYGTSETFTFTPDPNYLVLDVLVDGASNPAAVAAGSYPFTNVTRNHTIHVTFVKATYVITPNAGVGCTITPGTPQTVPYKGSQIFNIAANTGYNLVDVLVSGASQGPILSYTFTNVQADGTIAATCTPKPFVITPGWGAHGSITPGTPQTVLYGGSVTFTMVPDPGYTVDNVVVNGVSQGAITTYTFTNVTSDGAIVASFKKLLTFVITPTAGVHGTITPGTPQTVNYGGSVTFTITPDLDYTVDNVVVNGVSKGAITTYTFTDVTANGTIDASFKLLTFVITPTAGAHGTITPGTPQTVNHGGSVTFTITPDLNYTVDNVVVNGVSKGAITTYTFTDVTANGTIDATFKKQTYRMFLPIISK